MYLKQVKQLNLYMEIFYLKLKIILNAVYDFSCGLLTTNNYIWLNATIKIIYNISWTFFVKNIEKQEIFDITDI